MLLTRIVATQSNDIRTRSASTGQGCEFGGRGTVSTFVCCVNPLFWLKIGMNLISTIRVLVRVTLAFQVLLNHTMLDTYQHCLVEAI